MSSSRNVVATIVVLVAALLATGCGEGDPGALGPSGVDGGLNKENQRQEYTDGVERALSQMFSAQGPQFQRAIDTGNKRQLQAASLAWNQGVETLKQLDPPKDAADEHLALVEAVEGLGSWNQRLVSAAPNKAQVKRLARQAGTSPASQNLEKSVCALVDAGYPVADPGACTPFNEASPPTS